MASEQILAGKKARVTEVAELLKNSCAGVIVDYKGITVEEDTKLRKELREAGVTYFVEKNSILRFALKEAGISGLENVLEGTTAIATSKEDHVAAARILQKYADAKDVSFAIKTGYLEGEVISLETINSLAKLPTREVLLATVCNAFNAPIAAFARAIQAIVDKNGEAAPAAE